MADTEVGNEKKAEEGEEEKIGGGGDVEGATPAASASKGNDWELVNLTASTHASTKFLQAASDIPKEEEEGEKKEEEKEDDEEDKWAEAEGLLLEPDPDTDTAREEELVEPEEGGVTGVGDEEGGDGMGERKGEEKGWWWKRKASSLYNCVKEGNSAWSVFIAAAVVGFVLIWHHHHRHHHQRKPLLHLTS